jgi:hypothetical protein
MIIIAGRSAKRQAFFAEQRNEKKSLSHLKVTEFIFDETAKAFYHRLFKNWGLDVETER